MRELWNEYCARVQALQDMQRDAIEQYYQDNEQDRQTAEAMAPWVIALCAPVATAVVLSKMIRNRIFNR
jgi:uncharacterized protein YbaP (TraB family)